MTLAGDGAAGGHQLQLIRRGIMSRRERVEKTCRLSEVIIHITNIMHLRVGAEIIGVIAIFTADIEPHLDADTDPLHRGGIDIIPYQCPGIVRGPGKTA